jgi:hypothetical protein
MRTLTFLWRDDASLALKLAAGIESLYLRTAAHGAPISVTLWQGEGSGLEIRSNMHDLGPRFEIGVLEFVPVQRISSGDTQIDIPKSFNEHLRVAKLVITELDVTAESGITLENSRGEQIVIVAGANSYTLSIRGTSFGAESQPEYPLDRYQRVLMA